MSSIRLTQQENTPKDATAGQMMVYAKTDGQLYTKIGPNAETLVHAGSGWAVTTEGDIYTVGDAQVGIGVSDPSNSKLHVAGGHLNLDDDYAIAWGGGDGRASITGNKASSTLNINPGADGLVHFGGSTSTPTLCASQIVKAYARFNSYASLTAGFNISSIDDTGTGNWQVNFATEVPEGGTAVSDCDSNYVAAGNNSRVTVSMIPNGYPNTTECVVQGHNQVAHHSVYALRDALTIHLIVFGN